MPVVRKAGPKPGPSTGKPIRPEDTEKLREQEALIADLRKEITALDQRVKGLTAGAGPNAQALLDERDRAVEDLRKLTDEVERKDASHEAELAELRDKINSLSDAGGGVDVSTLMAERDNATEEAEAAKSELGAVKMMLKSRDRQLNDLVKEKSGWDERLEGYKKEKDSAVEDLAKVEGERDDLRQRVEDLDGEVEQAIQAAALAEEGAKDFKPQLEAVRETASAAGVDAESAGKEARKAKAAAFVGLLLALAAVGFGVYLFMTLRHVRYEVAVTQAHGGGMEPDEVEKIIEARVGELAGSLQTMSGDEKIEGIVGQSVKQAISLAMKSEAFQKRVMELAGSNAGAKGGGGGGGGLSPQDVKIMVDNQFRAITTYLKNEAVPKMVEDVLKKKG